MTGPSQYRFTQTFLDGELLRVFDLKATELCQETAANIVLVMDHFVAYFVPKEFLSKKKRYIRSNMNKPQKLTTRKYVGLFHELNSIIAQMPPLFNDT